MGFSNFIKKFLVTLVVILGLLIILNSQYLSKQTSYFFSKTISFSNQEESYGLELPPNTLAIQTLNIRAPIVEVAEKTEHAFQGALIQGVVRYPGTAPIGERGNSYLFGHSSDYPWKPGEYKTVFALLPHIVIGDKIVASNDVGKSFVYTVTETKIVEPNDISVLDQYENKKKILTIQTSYPIGTALKRFIVIAEIVK